MSGWSTEVDPTSGNAVLVFVGSNLLDRSAWQIAGWSIEIDPTADNAAGVRRVEFIRPQHVLDVGVVD